MNKKIEFIKNQIDTKKLGAVTVQDVSFILLLDIRELLLEIVNAEPPRDLSAPESPVPTLEKILKELERKPVKKVVPKPEPEPEPAKKNLFQRIFNN